LPGQALAYKIGELKIRALLPAYALLNRIRLTSSDAVLAAAEQTIKNIAAQYFAPNMSVEDLRELARSNREDPLRVFSDACREELKGLHRAA
jgi:hypothetical protein